MNHIPIEIKRNGAAGLEISWRDGTHSSIASKQLRSNCPCAVCREERGDGSGHDQPLTPKKSLLKVIEHTADEQLRLDQIWAVGNYALGIRWGDGHDTGIYTFDSLYELGK